MENDNKKDNAFTRMLDKYESQLPKEIESQLVHQASTFSVFSRVVELYGPNALDIASRFICGHPDCSGPQGDLEEDLPFWRIRP